MKTPEHIDDYVAMLDSGEPFALMNFGDGEWSWILGREITNCDGFKWSPDLTRELQRCILQPLSGNAFYGTHSGKAMCSDEDAWLHEQQYKQVDEVGDIFNIRWVNKEIISNANCQGKLQPLFQHVNNRKSLMIGPDHFRNLAESFFDIARLPKLLTVPLPLDFAMRGTFLILARKWIELSNPAIVTFSAGPMSNYLIHNLFDEFPHITMIDMGACFDPYCGVQSRSGYRKPKNIENMKANVPQ